MKIIKRNGDRVEFDADKIKLAIEKANDNVKKKYRLSEDSIRDIVRDISDDYITNGKIKNVEAIQSEVEHKLIDINAYMVATEYITYRYKRGLAREFNTTDKSIEELLEGNNDYWNNENSNKNAKRVTVQRDYLAGITSTDISKRLLIPDYIVEAHEKGIIHFHDMDYFAQKTLHNCELINLEDCLQNGTVINGVMIEKPHRLITAATIATQIITAVTSSSYGGATISLTHLAPFVRDSYNYYINLYTKRNLSKEDIEKFAKEDLLNEVKQAVQTFNYQVNSMTNTNGQAPFLSVSMYLNETTEYKDELALLIEEFLKQRILGFKNEKGVYITPAFPKLLYILEEDNIKPGSKYFYLTELAAKCTAKRMVPDYISEKVMLKLKKNKNGDGECYPCMGCRSFLTPDRFMTNISKAKNYKEGVGKYFGRFNQGVVTLSLPDIAFSSKGNMDRFWELFEERTELCHKALRVRHERLLGTKSDVAPILWQDGALARLEKDETIDELLYHGYSTISLGYAGLYECVKYMTGHSHTDGNGGKAFGLQVMQALNDKCNQWKAAEDIDYSVYGTPIESTTYKFATCLKKRFGDDIFVKLDGKDRNYITNSYHVPVFEHIDAFTKLALESEFQQLSPGGAISYVECVNLEDNIEAIITIIQYIYNTIMYAELNTKSDYCQKCGWDREILIEEDNQGKLIWKCPNCGNTDQLTMNVARRTCGYIGTQYFNQGRTNEIKDRYVHIDCHDYH